VGKRMADRRKKRSEKAHGRTKRKSMSRKLADAVVLFLKSDSR